MKALHKSVIVILTGILLLTGCSDITGSEEKMDFKKIIITNNNCTATNFIYEAEVDEDGVWLRAGTSDWSEEETSYYREFHADKTTQQQIAQKLQDCKATSWDGFNKSNSNVMDGSSFSLSIHLSDGDTIEAHGYNSSPKNYGDFESFFTTLILEQEIKETKFDGFNLEMTLPETWVENTIVRYDSEGLTFYLEDEESKDYILFIDINGYGYSDYYENEIDAGKLINEEGDAYYVTLRTSISVATQNKEYLNEKKEIIDGLSEDAVSIAHSMIGINGYTFFPND